MNLKIETLIILFDLGQSNNSFHPATCGGGGGGCSGVSLKARQVSDKDEVEMYCPKCNEHTQPLYDSMNMAYRTEMEDFKYLYDKLLMLQRDSKIKNIINN